MTHGGSKAEGPLLPREAWCTTCGDEAVEREDGPPLCGRCLGRDRAQYLRYVEDRATAREAV